MSTIIEVNGISKRYRLGGIGAHSFREELEARWRRLRGKEQTAQENPARDLWALRDISFTVNEGDILGILGHNGAGKSTLLKILSRITEPTAGKATIYGRVSSLLEVGTGFHPELSGRDNIYLSGAVHGMTKAEISRKFDEIVDFAGVGRFVDTPIKRYSSGMTVRLGFAVAAHLDPEILIVDEVLAVGDAQFQRKCIDKMKSLTTSGKTILFVSHNVYVIRTLCHQAMLLSGGKLVFEGSTQDTLNHYQREREGDQHRESEISQAEGIRYRQHEVNGSTERFIAFNCPGDIHISCDITVSEKTTVALGSSINTVDGTRITGINSFLEGITYELEPGDHRVGVSFSGVDLPAGTYQMAFSVLNEAGNYAIMRVPEAVVFEVSRQDTYVGLVGIPHHWKSPQPLTVS